MSDENPWWYGRCTHPWKPLENWGIEREAEGVAIIYDLMPNAFHIIVDVPGAGSSCKVITRAQYEDMSEGDLLEYLQNERRQLRSLDKM